MVLTGEQEIARQCHVRNEAEKKLRMTTAIGEMHALEKECNKERKKNTAALIKKDTADLNKSHKAQAVDETKGYPYCHCHHRKGGKMFACDPQLPDCPGNGWYHASCVLGIPEGADAVWSCPYCAAHD
jgi:hypothetical protein